MSNLIYLPRKSSGMLEISESVRNSKRNVEQVKNERLEVAKEITNKSKDSRIKLGMDKRTFEQTLD